jgi:protein arginine kinase
VAEEDHLRIQCLRPGPAVPECLDAAVALDRQLEVTCPWAVHPEYGYLTCCPTNTGTGLRAGVMLHLPALVITQQMGKVLRALTKLTMTTRGLYGEGSEASGHLFQISNQRTLGLDEAEIVNALQEVVDRIIAWERMARDHLLPGNGLLEDRICRALAVLRGARRLTSAEVMECWSLVRLGLDRGVVTGISRHDLDLLFTRSLPAHLQLTVEGADDPADRDMVRARLARTLLGSP